MVRVTFTLSDETVAEIRRTAARLRKPQSQVVREAVAEYASRSDRLSDAERHQALAIVQRLRSAAPTRPAADVDAELRTVRAARRRSGRRHPSRRLSTSTPRRSSMR
jgi:Arc/MetJ-type ribon-helix-helix transcriptional regulator